LLVILVAFADALECLAQNRQMGDNMGRMGRILAQRDFDRTYLAREFVGVISQT